MNAREGTGECDLIIRPGRPDDLEVIAEIERKSYPDPWSLPILHQSLVYPAPSSLVAEVSGDIVGYAFFRIAAGELEIHSLTVAPCWRRRGIATRLLESIEREARGAGVTRILLEVRESNAPALRLYRLHGFVVDTVRRGYYANGENAVLMSRELGNVMRGEKAGS